MRGRLYDRPFDPRSELNLDLVDIAWGEVDYPKQREFCTQSARTFQLFLGGRSTGKSWVLTLWILLAALRNPGAPVALLGRTGRELNDKLKPALDAHLQRIKDATGLQLATFDRASQEYRLANGAVIQCRPYGRADTLRDCRGYSWAAIAVDEIEHASEDSKTIFDLLMYALRHERAQWKAFASATTPDGLRGLTAHFAKMSRAGSPNYFVKHATIYDNPHNDAAWIEALREGCSPRLWAQEGLGQILRPVEVVYDFDESRHLVPWRWSDAAPYILVIDWGESHAYFGAIQIVGGLWVFAREEKHEDTSRPRFRDAILRFVREVGRAPYAAFADRAVTKENAWLRGALGPSMPGGVATCESSDEQRIKTGVAMVESMLNPSAFCEICDGRGRVGKDHCESCDGRGAVASNPRLVFSTELDRGLATTGRGIVGALLNYRYRKTSEGIITSEPLKDDLNDHPVDALRYGVMMGAYDTALHGGSVLPYVVAHEVDLGGAGSVRESAELARYRAQKQAAQGRTGRR